LDGYHDLYVKVRDNVGNEGSSQAVAGGVTVDTDSPTGFTVTWARHTGIVDGYHAYLSGSTIYFNSIENEHFTVTIPSSPGTIQNSGFWKSQIDVNGVIDPLTEDTGALPNSDDCYYQAAGSGTFRVLVVNNAGNYQTLDYTATPDATGPSGYSLALVADGATIGYVPNNGYYDDDSVDVDATDSGSITETGAGLPSTCYTFQRNAESWSGFQSSDTYSFTSTTDGSHTLYVKVRDYVGNNGTAQSNPVTVDTDSPTGFTVAWARHSGIVDGYHAYLSGSTIYFNSGQNDYFSVTVPSTPGTIQNSGFWKTQIDVNGLIDPMTEDTGALPNSDDCNYQGAGSGTFRVRVVNNAGNYQTLDYTATPDATGPSGYSLALIADIATIGYTPNSGYYDDDSVDVDATDSGSITETGAGLPTACYNFQIDTNGWFGWQSGDIFEFTSVLDGDHDLYVNVRDNVGNEGSSQSVTGGVTVDTDSPTGFTITWARHTGIINGFYAYLSGSTIYFNSSQNDYFTVTIPSSPGTIQNSEFWKTQIDVNGLIDPITEDTGALPNSDDCYYQAAGSGTFRVRVVNNAGNYQTLDYTATPDTIGPTINHNPSATNESSSYLYYDGSSAYCYYSDNMGASSHSFNVGGTASDAGAGLYSITDSHPTSPSFGGDPIMSGSLDSWSFGYSIDQDNSSAGTITITYIAKDNVDNTNSVTFQFRIDNDAPTIGSLDLLLTPDTDSVGNGIDPNIGYDDDGNVSIEPSGAPTDSDSGIPTVRFSYKYEGGTYGSWLSGGTTLTSVPEGNQTLYIQVRDNVENTVEFALNWVIVDSNNPTGYTSAIFETNNAQYLYMASSTLIYFNGAYDDLGFDIRINDTNGIEANFWKVRQPAAFGEPQEELTTSPYNRTIDYNIDSTDSGRTIDVLIIDYAGRIQTITITIAEDSNPSDLDTLDLILTADTDTVGNGIAPDTDYYDDDSVNVTITGTPDDSGSGLPSARYSYKYDGGAYGSWLSSGTTLTSVPEGPRTIYVRVIDNVGNIATDIDSVGVVVDLTPPTGYTSAIYETNNAQYLYMASSTLIYFNGAQDNLGFDIGVFAGTEDNFWMVRQPAAFGELEENLTAAPYRRSTDYEINSSDSEATIDVLVLDHAGQDQTITISVTEDSTPPTLNTLDLLLTADTDTVGNGIDPDTGYYDDDSIDVTITGTPDDSGSGLPTERYSYKHEDGSYGSWMSGGTMVDSVQEGNKTIYVRVVDRVGNIAPDLASVWVVVDLTNPIGYTSMTYETNKGQYLYNVSNLMIYFNGAYDDLGFDIGINDTNGIEANFWKVRQPAAFGEPQEELTTSPYNRTTDYDIDSTDSGTTIDVLIIDLAGRTQTITITVTEDSTPPSFGSLSLDDDATDKNGDGYDPQSGWYDDLSQTITVDFSGESDSLSGIQDYWIKITSGGTYGSTDLDGIDVGATYGSEGTNLAIYYAIQDNVGNWKNGSSGTVNIDDTEPTGCTTAITESVSDLYAESGTILWISNSTPAGQTFYVTGTFGTETNIYGVTFSGGGGTDTGSPYQSNTYTVTDLWESNNDISVDFRDQAGNIDPITIDVIEDSTAPSISSITADLDTDSDGNGYDPYDASWGGYEAFYDDSSFTADMTGLTETGSGIDIVQIRSNLGSYGTSELSGTNVSCTLVIDANNTIIYRLVDKVNNTEKLSANIDVYYGTTAPSNFDIDISGALAWAPGVPNFVFIATPTDIQGGTLYINTGESDTWSISVDAEAPANWQSGGAWQVIFTAGWGASQKADDTDPPPYASNTYGTGAGGAVPNVNITIVNRCGISSKITLDTTEDITPPSMTSITVRGNDSGLEDWDKDGTGFSITPSTIIDTGSGNNGYFVNNSVSPTLYHTFAYAFPGFEYPGDVGVDGNYTFYAYPIDKVGNNGTVKSDNGIVDENPPGAITAQFTNEGVSPNWFDQGSVSTAIYRIDFSEPNVDTISVSVSGGISATGAGEDQSSPFDSSLSIGGKTDGTYSITVTITDKAGHTTTSFTGPDKIKLDNTPPTADFLNVIETPSSDYLYWNSSSGILWYGDGMGSPQSFTIDIDAVDVFVGLKNATVSNQFGGTDIDRTDLTNASGSPTYEVPVVNVTYTSDFIGTLIVSVYDLLGNVNTTTLAVSRDTIDPTGYSLSLVADTDSNNDGINPNNNYYDDLIVDFVINGAASDGTGSGLLVNYYGFSLDGGTYEWQSGTTKQYTMAGEDNHTVILRAKDNVGNNETFYEEWVWVDTGSPEKFDLDWGRASGLTDGYFAFYNDTEGSIKFRADKNDYFNVTVFDNGTSLMSSSDFWKIFWDINSVFESVDEEIITGLNASKGFNYYGDVPAFFIIRLVNNAGNYQQWNITAKEFVQDLIIEITSITEISEYLYYDGTSSFGYYSDRMGSTLVDFVIEGYAYSSDGIAFVNDSTTFGEDPSNNTFSATNASWIFTYEIDQDDGPTYGTFVTTFIAYDTGGFNGTTTFEFRFDDTDPIINLGPSAIIETSPYLYYDGSSSHGYYSDNMGGTPTTFTVGGTANDGTGVGLYSITDNTSFGEGPSNGGSNESWSFDYNITDTDSSYGTISVTFTATDLVENNATVTFEFRIDNVDPSITFSSSTTSESSNYLYYDGSDHGYYSNNMAGTPATFTVGGTANDSTGVGLYTITDNTDLGGNPSNGGSNESWSFDYDITDTDSLYGNISVTFTATDLVENTAIDTFEFRIDNADPTISTPLVENPSNSPYIYITPAGDYFFFSNNMGGTGIPIKISGTTGDGQSGPLNVTYTSHFGDSPPSNDTTSWSSTYSIHGTDQEQTGPETDIIITSTDNVGNQITATVTFLKDNYDPEVSIDSLSEYLLPQYLHIAASDLLYYSNNGAGARAFAVTILGQETHANLDAGLKNSSFPDIFNSDGGFNTTSGSGDSHHLYWPHQYSFSPTTNANGSYIITVYDLVGNSGSTTLEIYKDDNDPVVNIIAVEESSWLLNYTSGTLYYSNDQSMNALFRINMTVDDGVGESGRASVNGTTAFGETPSSSDYSNNYYSIVYYINKGESDEGNLIITGYDRVGNSANDSITLTIDNDGPTGLAIEDVIGHDSSEFLHYTGGILYYSNWDTGMSESFTIRVSGNDGSGVGRLNATGEVDLGETNVYNTTYTTYYELTYTVDPGDSADDGKIDIYFYDLVGNNNSISLTTTLDNNGPVSLVILGVEVYGSELLYYNVSHEILFYSNDQPMIESFTIQVNAIDTGAGLKNATGEDDFQDPGVGDSILTGFYELDYDIQESESASGDTVIITIFDMCGNTNSINLNTSIDNSGPQDVTITQINDLGSKYIHLYNDSGILTLYVSNKSSIDHTFLITIVDNEPIDESGRKIAIGELYFGETPNDTTYQYSLSYTINPDNVENGTLTIWTYDKCNNNNSVQLTIYGDLTPPQLSNNEYFFDDHNSDYLHFDDSQFFFSDNMPVTQIITIYGTGTDGTGGSGVDRVSYQSAFGSSPPTDLGSSFSVDYGIDSTDPENDTAPGTINITITDRVNNNYTFQVPYVTDNIAPSGLTIDDIIEDLLAEYLHYVNATTTLFYSNVRPEKGSRKFTIRVNSSDMGGAELRNASYPDIGTGFSSGGYDTSHVGGLWEFSYLINNPSSATYSGSVNITVYDNVANFETIDFTLFRDITPPQGLTLTELDTQNSEFLYYNPSQEKFYYSNDQPMSEPFTIKITGYDTHSGLFSANGSFDFEQKHNTTTFDGNFSLTYTINTDNTSGSDLAITVYDNVGNSDVFNLITSLDNTPPQSLNIVTVEDYSSVFLYYNPVTFDFYFSNTNPTMSESFTIRVNGTDSGAGRKNATGEVEFGDGGVNDTSYTTYYELTYEIIQNDNVSDGKVTIWMYDRVGNPNSINLTCIKDNTGPSVAITTVLESSPYLYNESTSTFYYSNNKPGMSESFIIRVTGSDGASGRFKAVGSSDFGVETPQDTTYSGRYELTYTVTSGEDAGGDDQIIVTIFDRCNNTNSVALDCIEDNNAPDIVTLDSITGTDTSDYLYYNGTVLFYSNDQSMSESFVLHINVTELLSGVEIVTGSLDFDETPSSTTNVSGTFDLQYTIDQSETASDNLIQVNVTDKVGNVNSTLTLTVILDNDAPINIILEDILGDEESDFLYFSGTILYYSNTHSGQNELFSIKITCQDSSSGLLRADGSNDFSDTPSDTSPYLSKGYYLVNYTVGETEEASGDQISITVYDNVNNGDSETLNLNKDIAAPTGISIDDLAETSDHLFYDSPIKKLYYSNNQFMSAQFNVTILAQDNVGGAGLLNATGSFAFNEQPWDDTYNGGYLINYTVSEFETGGAAITFSVYDRVGNVNSSISLNLELDNTDPTKPTITVTESSEYLLYSGSIFYYSNDQTMSDSFTIHVTTNDTGAGRFKAVGSADFNDAPPEDTDYSGDEYQLIYTISSITDTDGGDGVLITVFDKVGNNNTNTLSCILDNTPPTLPVITQIVESSEYLFNASTSTLYYSNNKPGMSESFTIHITVSDAAAGRLKAVGSVDFGGETPEDTDYSSGYELTYIVSIGETAGIDNNVTITVFDRVSNTNHINVSCILDNTGPTGVIIDDVIEESGAQFLYYHDSSETFYYSNDNPGMSESFTVQILASDALSDIQKANASEFFDDVENDTYGVNGYELTFTVNFGESEPSFLIKVWDNVGNPTSVALTTVVDNTPPENLQIVGVSEYSDFLHYNSSGVIFYFSNDQTMTDSFTIHVSGTDSGAGRKNATGEDEFSDPNVGDPGDKAQYDLTYDIEKDEDVSDEAVTIWLFDNVGNNNSISLTCRKDNIAPSITIDSHLNKTWYNTLLGISSFSGTATDDLGIFNSGITNSSFKHSQYDGTAEIDIIINNSLEVQLTGVNWLEDDEITPINDANITLTIYVWDRVNNTNSASVEIWHDDTTPTITYNDPTDGGDTPFYILADESTATFDVDFVANGSKTFYSSMITAEYRTDDGTGWITIFDNPSLSVNTTDWKILDWTNSLFNGNNTIDIRVTDEAGNTLTHQYVPGISGFNFRYDIQGPLIVTINVKGNEFGIPKPALYDWNGSNFNLTFTFNSSTVIDYIYIYSDNNSIEQKFNQGDIGWLANDPIPDYHSVTNVLIHYDIGVTGNRSIYIRAENNAGLNSSWIEVKLFVDEEDPTITLQTITEVSWKWRTYAKGNILYYSDDIGLNYADFDVTVNALDSGSGMTYGFVIFEAFDGYISQQNVTETGSFNATSSTTNETWVSAYAVDASGRSSTTENLVWVLKDNGKPTNLKIENVTEISEFLYYNSTLYFSNLQLSSEPLTINVTAQDNQAGLGNLTGSVAFSETLANRSDTSYSNGFLITYYVDTGESASSISCVVYDRVGNNKSILLTTVEDTGKPTSLTILPITEESEFIYYNGSTLFYSNDKPGMNDPFTVNLTAIETLSGIQNVTGSFDFGETHISIDNPSGTFDLTYYIGEGETASGAVLTLTVFDNVGNSESTSLTCILDNDDPTLPVTSGVTETSEYLYFDGSTLFYTNNKSGMNELFIWHFTTSDASSGLLNATGSIDFDETPYNFSSVGDYDLNYTISSTEDAGVDNQIVATVYDNVGNTVSISLTCTLDNAGPTGVTITDVILQSGAQYLYYNSSAKVFYYSNNQSMDESFTVHVSALDSSSGILKANSSEFIDDVENDTYGVNGYELTFNVEFGESAPDFNIIVWDNVGNPTNIGLNTFEDNFAPQSLQIVTVLESPLSDYLYYDGTEFFFSNDQFMSASFTIRVNGTDTGVGLKNATGEEEFLDTNIGDTDYTTYYELTYEISLNDGVADGAVTVRLFDRVGNWATIDLTCNEDNREPNIWLEDTAVTENTDFTYYISDGTQILWYSNQMPVPVDFNVTVSTDDGSQSSDSGLRFVEFPASFNRGTEFNSIFLTQTYSISSTSSDSGNMNFTSFDNCGNFNTTTLEIRRDTQAPSGSIISIDESNSHFVHTQDLNKLWYSNLMGASPQSVIIIISTSDGGGSNAGVYTTTFPAIGDEDAENITLNTRTYSFTASDNTNETVNLIIYDNVANTYQISLQVIKDLKSPEIVFSDVSDPDYDPSGNELDNLDNWYDQGLLTTGFDILSSPSDTLSEISNTTFLWSSTGGDSHSGYFGVNGDGTVTGVDDDSDGVITITLTAYDNVNNSAQTSIIVRFDNSEPNAIDTTILHQNGPVLTLSGQTDDVFGSDIKNVTIDSTFFDPLATSESGSWSLDNSSSADSFITPGQNISVNIHVFDNVGNVNSSIAYITFHTFNLVNFITTIPPHVEIDDPGTWNISFSLKSDGYLRNDSNRNAINRDVLVSQFNVSIDGLDLTIIDLLWDTTGLTLTVTLPDSGPTIGYSYDIQLDWWINDLPSIQVTTSYTEPNVVTYHDLDIYYVSDNLTIIETNNTDLSLMEVTLHFEDDGSPYPGALIDENINLTVDGFDAVYLGYTPLGNGDYNITFQLPGDLSTGLKDIDFTWRYGLGSYYYVIESNNSLGGVVTYHDIVIDASVPTSMQLFEIDDDFYFNVSFDVREDEGDQALDLTPNSALQELSIKGLDLTDQITSLLDHKNGSYFFSFDLFDSHTDITWVGNKTVSFRIQTPSGLVEKGKVKIRGHDLFMEIISIWTDPGAKRSFDPDEQTTFNITMIVYDDIGSGYDYVRNLNIINFFNVYLENIQPESGKNVTISETIGWWNFTDQVEDPGKYVVQFVLQAQDATHLGTTTGSNIMLNLMIKDEYGHFVMSSSDDYNWNLESKDFVLLLGLEWILTPYEKFTFEYGAENATVGYTFRVSVGSNITINYRIFALENPLVTIKSPQTIKWEDPQGERNETVRENITITISSNQPLLQTFVAFVEFHKENQYKYLQWFFNLEWDKMEASTVDADDDEDDLNNTVLNIGNNYTLTYNTLFSQSGKPASGSMLDINLTLWQFIGTTWVEINRTSFEHLDGKGSTGSIYFNNGTMIIGRMTIFDVYTAEKNDADGTIVLQFQFNDIIRVTVTVNSRDESKTSGKKYREYPSEKIFSYVNETSDTLYPETIIWTKFNVRITTPDDRLPRLEGATIFVEAHYAHDVSLDLTNVRVYVLDTNINLNYTSEEWIDNQVSWSNVLSQGEVENVTYKIVYFDDDIFGISVFEEVISKASEVKLDIKWDQIIFMVSLAKPWGNNTRFNVNSPAYVQIVAYYANDRTPFNGTITLFHTTTSNVRIGPMNRTTMLWNESVEVLIEYPYETLSPQTTFFLMTGVIEDIHGLNGTLEGQGYHVISDIGEKWLNLRWDRVIVDFYKSDSSDPIDYLELLPGDSINVTLKAYYESDGKLVNTSYYEYSLYKNDLQFLETKRSSLFFFDHEVYEANNTYRIVYSNDSTTNLIGAYSSTKLPQPSITISWIDGQKPQLIDQKIIDFGNGTLGFLVIATDDLPEKYFGSGLVSVTSQLTILAVGFPSTKIYELDRYSIIGSEHIFFGKIKTDEDPSNLRDYFKYGDNISYTIVITDKNGNFETKKFSTNLDFDSEAPEIDGVIKLHYSSEIEGNLNITFKALDNWSGPKNATVRFFNPSTNKWSLPKVMSINDITLENKSTTFWINSNFTIGTSIQYNITIYDRSGNSRVIIGYIQVIDKAGPRLLDSEFTYNKFGAFDIRITVGDNGSLVESAVLFYQIDGEEPLHINITELVEVGGGGSSIQRINFLYSKTFAKRFTILPDFITAKVVTFLLVLKDSEGNNRTISNEELSNMLRTQSESGWGGEISPSSFEILTDFRVLIVIIAVFLAIALVAVQRFRTISGFDKKKIIQDLEKISETEVWEKNDNISLGLIASVFDQVKGPVPIVWHPEKLGVSEMMIHSLADRSFSTLGFVSNPEEDKDATFRFQVGGEKCAVFGYAFAFANPEARGGQENLSLCFVIRPPWGNLENLNKFKSELLEKSRRIHQLMEEKVDIKIVQKEMQETRNFFTRTMLTFRKKYTKEFIE
jgi:hypothetical protein